ncbi:MAG TPA: ribosome-associated translation inhibitor RaiA [Streptosporangiaceae bacterium]|nr:ribosome-associated translation inhibitor RaiA [Streptosporangiaceae bacterium]
MDIIFNGRQTDVAARFRDQATAKLEKLEKLDQKAIRVDVEVSVERNPRQSSQKERVELTVVSRGPAIRAEAAAEDRFAALDIALAKLDSRVRRALDRRKRHHGGRAGQPAERRTSEQPMRPEDIELPEPAAPAAPAVPAEVAAAGPAAARAEPRARAGSPGAEPRAGTEAAEAGESSEASPSDSVVPIDMEGDGPLVVRQKFHHAIPISIDQALLEMELVGHDFYLFHDIDEDMPSVVYRRRGYQYGVIRLVEGAALSGAPGEAPPALRSGVPGRRRSAGSGAAGQPSGQAREESPSRSR